MKNQEKALVRAFFVFVKTSPFATLEHFFTKLSIITMLKVMSAGQGGADLARAGIEASRGERAAAAQQRRQSRARIDPGGQFGYEMFKM